MRRLQHGFNLISLMIGMTLSLISVLAMLSLYKNAVGVSVTFIQESQQDGQVAAALLTARRELRSAGFWRPESTDTSLKLLVGAELNNGMLSLGNQGQTPALGNPATPGNALVWAYKSAANATASCAALIILQNQNGQTQNGRLLSLKSTGTCTSTAQWNSTTWASTQLIEKGQPAAFFTTEFASCWPFDKTADTSNTRRAKVTMTANTSTEDISGHSSSGKVQRISEICLPNLPEPAAG